MGKLPPTSNAAVPMLPAVPLKVALPEGFRVSVTAKSVAPDLVMLKLAGMVMETICPPSPVKV